MNAHRAENRSRKLDRMPPALRGGLPRWLARARRWRRLVSLRFVGLGPFVRRTCDIVVTGVALLMLAPLFAATVVAVRFSSRGPAFFSQERLGRGGRPFKLWKFRTMICGADKLKSALAVAQQGVTDGVRFKIRRDPRVTPVGRILRRFSIDELPQLWNVFRGDMTLLGPRPPVWREVALYSPRALRRLEAKPGLTCLWQVGGRSDLSFEQQVELDLQYIDRTTVTEELTILGKTVPAVLTGRGAY
ncbi:MAG: sugar transferase [Myxococcales bacterium]|nr:sugar transferase [Myxococcales bacterium]